MNAEFDAQNFERKVKTVEEAEFYELMDGSSPPEFWYAKFYDTMRMAIINFEYCIFYVSDSPAYQI